MAEINHLGSHPRTKRDYDQRSQEKTDYDKTVAKQFGYEFFDGPRSQGYGGYAYDGRWQAVARRLSDYYSLPPDAAILDVGCAKGFLLHDFKQLMPDVTITGIDVSSYAVTNSLEGVRPYLTVGSGEDLPYADSSFDLVISINSIHNLPIDRCRKALKEIQRVARAHAYITVDAWRTQEERENLMKWILTAETYMHVDEWQKLFRQVGYAGDYYWFIAD